MRKHRHQHERRKETSSRLPIIRSLAEIGRNHSSSKSKCFTVLQVFAFKFIRLQVSFFDDIKGQKYTKIRQTEKIGRINNCHSFENKYLTIVKKLPRKILVHSVFTHIKKS